MPNLLFLYLKAFSATGGIEKVNRVLLKALHEMQQEGHLQVTAASPYATVSNEKYFPNEQLVGYAGSRLRFMGAMLFRSWKVDTLLVGHINLAPAVWLLRLRYPRMKVIVIAHGIEVWGKLSWLRKKMLQDAERIISVSGFTKDKLVALQGVRAEQVSVLPNCLDVYFEAPQNLEKPAFLLERYGLKPEQKVLLTITRLSIHETYKGYDNVLASIPALLKRWPDLLYIIGGKYDAAEKQRIDAIINRLHIGKNVRVVGFLPDEELNAHYCLADVFVMPSKKEGFGLVFIEAMACGTPAIGGNLDGSVEALRHGELGYAIDPESERELVATLVEILENPVHAHDLQQKSIAHFQYPVYHQKLKQILIH